MIALVIATVLFAATCVAVDMFTGTAFWQTETTMEGNTMFDYYSDPEDHPDFVWVDPAELDLDGWDDLDGIDVDGFSYDAAREDVAWLHAVLYSDYADPSDDDDRPGMDIPRYVLDSLSWLHAGSNGDYAEGEL